VLPKYLWMQETFSDRLSPVSECEVQLNWRTQPAGILQTVEDGITFYFIENDYYFAGPAPYGQIYQDAEKFAFFSKAVLTMLPEIGFCPDIIHCHDWQTGLIPTFLAAFYRQEPFYHHIRTVFTIHNLKFQGRWYIDAIRDVTGLGPEYFTMDTLENYGQANLLKGGLVFADHVTTVSETYAKEIQTIDGGEGLDGLLRARDARLSGIVNGLDYDVLDPSADCHIAQRFEGDIAAYKHANKADLQRTLGLAEDDGAFLIGMVSRLTDQKGFDLVNYILDEIMGEERIQIVVLGTGEDRYESMFRYYEGKYPGRVSANICYSEELAQKIYASCDAFLMPSLFEPCGLSQLMALRYGTVPLVRETGGLKDTVEAYNEFEHTGTGFSFHNYNAHEMLYMIRYACKIFTQEPEEWLGIIRRGMAMDFSWNVSSERYSLLYDALIAEEEKRTQEEERLQREAEREEQQRREEEMMLRIRLEKEMEEAKQEAERKQAAAKKPTKKTAASGKTATQKSTEKKSAASGKTAAQKSTEKKSAAKREPAKKTVKKTAADPQ
ncbi:MAG: glycogen/starch synthase, partial [Clostridiales bacterium]|nr:glycogen/starch synthase [Clostridiales bacterium]